MSEGCLIKFLWGLLAAVLLTIAAVIGAWVGYEDGVQSGFELATLAAPDQVREQYQLAIQDYEYGRYDLARQRFVYVLTQAPGEYPEAAGYIEGLEAALETTATFTPTVVTPTLTLTPTPDTRQEEAIFASAKSLIAAGDWTAAIETLIALRNKNLTYRVYEVDDMLYAALRNRGEDKILRQGDLEGGIYDLSLAEKFGPLDYQAVVYRDWARLYLTALGFWEAYPAQAVYYFGQIAAAAPGLQDSVGWTAGWRYRMSLIHYGDQLASEGKWCEAEAQYQASMDLRQQDGLRPTLMYASNRCATPTPDFSPTPQVTATSAATSTSTFTLIPGQSATPTVTATVTSDPQNTATSTSTATATPESTSTPTSTPTPSDTPVDTPTFTPTATFTNTPTSTETPTPSNLSD
jgi:tetratricopeptide (TPR) repeat protein